MMRRLSRLDIAVFGGILILGLARLPAPFTGDQALNMLMGEVIAEGGAPYVDLWDLKHPGIFCFFGAAGSLFGFSEIGIHLFELLWMLALALAVRLTTQQFLDNNVAVSLAPALTVGFYYAAASSLHLTQAEAIVGLPLLLSLASLAAAVRPGTHHPLRWLFVSGFSAGVVLVFKAPYVALPGIFWLLALVELRRRRGKEVVPSILDLAWPPLAGAFLPVSASVIYLAAQHALDHAWWTFTVHPREAATQIPLEPQRLLDASVWFVRTFGVLLALAMIGAWSRVRRGWDLMTAALIAWMLGGLLLIWAQVIGWWSYHYLLLLVPVGLLAAQGADSLWAVIVSDQGSRYRRAVATALLLGLIVVVIPQIQPGMRSVAAVLRARPFPFDNVSARRYQAGTDDAYAEALETTSFLRVPESHAGPIYVFGSPILYPLAGRRPAIAPLATWFHPTSDAWHWMTTDLIAASPAYVFLTDGALESTIRDNPALTTDVRAIRSWLERQYRRLRTDVAGTWYLRHDLAASAAQG